MARLPPIDELADEAVEQLRADIVQVVGALRGYLAELLKSAARDADGKLVSGAANAEIAAKLGEQLVEVLRGLGYDAAVSRLLSTFDRLAQETHGAVEEHLGASFTTVDHGALGAFVSGVVQDLLSLKGQAAEKLRAVMLLASQSNVPIEKAIDELADAAQVTLGQARSLADTSLLAFHREILASQAEEAGFDLFVYVGPDDALDRPFCAEHVGQVYTQEDLDDEDNGQGLEPTSRYLGGYNCRHLLSPISVEQAQAMSAELIAGPQAQAIVLKDKIGPAENAFVEAHRGQVIERGGRQQVVRRRVASGRAA